ncbi:MAG: oligosaccharide flippase family protein [Sphingomonadales bacterium]|nr:oligosaccharide flippase family protein [Sphingomonadales bacterium]MBK6718343.1 oligosaccharide flippase family protein [Sphingomonadales bacterium]MBK8272658.1 oligosaccharide flippase family protein [Sphingomonadales bacterium]MBK8860385.1 oligosaccharide flippase family protein [Sphingomonadales bacterium]MBK9588337.1 oligosaccharide flippase family protein [Sphingomonadales bacterium]
MKLFRDFSVLAGGQLASKALGFLAFAWIARALDPVGYGAVEYVVGLTAFFALLVDGGLGVVGTRRAIRNPDELALLAHQIPAARLMMAVVFVPVMALIALATIHVSVPQGLVWLFAASLLTAPWRQQWLFQATGRMASVANAEILRMAVFAFGVWIFVHSPADILAVGTAELCAVVAMTALCIHVQQRHVTPFRLTGSFSGFGALVREGAAVGSTNFVWALAQSAPLFLVASLSGGLETAWFAGAARIVGSLGQFGNLYHFNLYPSVSRAYALADGSLGQMQARSMRVTAWGGVFIALTLTVLAEPLVKLALGSKLLAAAPLLEILCWILPVALWSGHSRGALAAAGEQKKVLASQIIGLVATVAACVGLGLVYGSIGYAAGSLIGAVVVWAASHRFARSQGCEPPAAGFVIMPLALAAAVIALTRWQMLGFWQSALAIACYAAAAPLFDRSLIRDITQLGHTRLRSEADRLTSDV